MNEGTPTREEASVFGQDTERLIAITGWISEELEPNEAVFLIYPHGHGIASRMRHLADLLGLGDPDVNTEVPPDTAHIELENRDGTPWMVIHYANDPFHLLARPVNEEFATVMRTNHAAGVFVTFDGYTRPRTGHPAKPLRRNRIRGGRLRVSHT